jgi:GTP:adenosylcobinamide-phosphate guanylyltransferase
VDFYILSGAIAVIIIAMGGKGQRLGDVVAGTSVVKLVEQEQISSEKVFVAPEQEYTPTFSQVINLTEKDIELIQRALEANRDQGNIQPVIMITEKIKSLLSIQTDMPPVKFLYTIIKDYQTITAA